MPRRLSNALLYLLVVGLIATGVLGWTQPEDQALPLTALHRALGVAVVLVLAWKQLVVRGSMRRRLGRPRADRSVLVGVTAGLAFLGSVGLGLAWTLRLVRFDSLWGYSPLNVHVFLGLGVVPLLWWHVIQRRERGRLGRDLVGRRGALQLAGLSLVSVCTWGLLERAAEARAAPGTRRPTGSQQAGTWGDFPVTIWMFDGVPTLDRATWRLGVVGKVAEPGALSYDDLVARSGREVRAILDCTGGWWSEQVWAGASVGEILDARGVRPEAGRVDVVSVTGHRWSFPLDELRGALLATHVGGDPLTPGHGYPARLVVPGQRGFQWVKWVDRLEVG